MGFLLKIVWFHLLFLSRIIRTLFAGVVGLLLLTGYMTTRMPGSSFEHPLPELSKDQIEYEQSLRFDVDILAGRIGERHVGRFDKYEEAVDYLEFSLREAGYDVLRYPIVVKDKICYNLVAEITGKENDAETVVVGAPYDSPENSVAANASASGVAALLALARKLADREVSRTLRFVLFANEAYDTLPLEKRGSNSYAETLQKDGESVKAVLTLESLGYYSQHSSSQKYPLPLQFFYPDEANFVAFVGNTSSANLVQETIRSFRNKAQFPSQGFLFPDTSEGLGGVCQRAFWRKEYPAVLITDTGESRNPYHATRKDLPRDLNYAHMARVVDGLEAVLVDLVKVKKRWYEFFD
ncbi:MAG: M28 family peptidase [Calditrichia bacterium]